MPGRVNEKPVNLQLYLFYTYVNYMYGILYKFKSTRQNETVKRLMKKIANPSENEF